MKRLDTLWCKGETMLFLVHISSVAQVGPAAPGCRYSWIIQSHAVHHIHAALGVGRPGSCVKDDAGADVGQAVAGLHRSGADL